MRDFDEYLRPGEPGRQEKAHVWKTAINPPEEWRESAAGQAASNNPTSTPQAPHKFVVDNEKV